MGVKHFFIWYKNNFKNTIQELKTKQGETVPEDIDILALDLNGIFHKCAQKIYRYGNFERDTHLSPKYPNATLSLQIRVFKEICNEIEEIRNVVKPRKKLMLCIDGVAGLGKMSQQRQRRFLSAKQRTEKKGEKCPFDQNSITPGTKFMHNLSKYIDYYTRFMVSHHPEWQNLEIYYSNEKVCGEGEHKIISYIRKNSPYDRYCIYGADADLFMLALSSEHDKIWILRENTHNVRYDKTGLHHFIDISKFREKLASDHLGWCSDVKFKKQNGIDDFVFMCFLVGNDFLPNVPTMSILEGGIDNMIQIYRRVGKQYGHLTRSNKNYITFKKKAVEAFFKELAELEKPFLEDKWENRETYFPDLLLNDHMKTKTDGGSCLMFDNYMNAYFDSHFSKKTTIKKVCDYYLMGMKWVINYYKYGMPDWEWFYPFHYAPFFSMLHKQIDKFDNKNFKSGSSPITQFEQLLIVISPQSSELLPRPLDKILGDKNTPLSSYNTTNFEIDVSGKRREWEGIVKLPIVDLKLFLNTYKDAESKISYQDKMRNKIFKPILYSRSDNKYTFKSFYGNIDDCFTRVQILSE